jgi:hypothetical protein
MYGLGLCACIYMDKLVVVVHVDGVRLSLNCGLQRAYCSSPSWCMSIESHGGMILTGQNRKTRSQTSLSATLSSTYPIWTDMDTNPALRGETPATNRLSHGTATYKLIFCLSMCACIKGVPSLSLWTNFTFNMVIFLSLMWIKFNNVYNLHIPTESLWLQLLLQMYSKNRNVQRTCHFLWPLWFLESFVLQDVV